MFEFDYLIFSTFIRTSLFSKHDLSDKEEENQRPLLPRKGEAPKTFSALSWMFFEAEMDLFPFHLIFTLCLPNTCQDFENSFVPFEMRALDKDSIECKMLPSI